ncbi:MAG: hypothetical protein HYV62_01060 [Candidatus Rokubacteria bacterium]|nr:hypothetical protein [Candidatus Rokubacteria bacterium]
MGSFRLCLRWLWRLEMENRADIPTPDWIATIAALQAVAHSLAPGHAGWIVTEEARRWEARTGWAPRMRTFEDARKAPIPAPARRSSLPHD